MPIRNIFLACAVWLAAVASVTGQLQHPLLLRNHPAISYATTPVSDPVAELDRHLQHGTARLEHDAGPTGYLRSVLKALDVPVESQMLVFSKTSFQAPRINPQNPRAIYFNDSVSIGWVRGGEVLELIAQDPKQGAIFYTLSQAKDRAPRFERNDACLSCHTSDATQYVPGWFLGSVFPGPDGTTRYGPAYTTDHRTPFEIRYGGWYVTGDHEGKAHMGNAIAHDPGDLRAMMTPDTIHVTSLQGRFDMTGYLSPHSDLVALVILEHQAQMLNLMTRLGWEARMGADAKRPLANAAAELVDYMLFIDEAPLPGPISGTTRFARDFETKGPRDGRGRSLRELDLNGRLLKYPCSYLVYSPSFDGMPAEARAAAYQRLWEVLSGEERGERYAKLTAADREAILEILRETKADLPGYFHAGIDTNP
jgi:hypothetical protein